MTHEEVVTFIDIDTDEVIHSTSSNMFDDGEIEKKALVTVKGVKYEIKEVEIIINGHKQYKVYVKKEK